MLAVLGDQGTLGGSLENHTISRKKYAPGRLGEFPQESADREAV
jgi:hypothetical protein